VIVFDACGSWEGSDTPPYSHDQWAADIDALRSWADADKIIMAAGSYGEYLALKYAVHYLCRVAALVLRDTAAAGRFRAQARYCSQSTDRTVIDMEMFDRSFADQLHGTDDFQACWHATLPLYDYEYDPAKADKRLDTRIYQYATHNDAFAVNLPRINLADQLGRIPCPAPITVGRHDWITPVPASQDRADGIANSRLIVFEKSGHSPLFRGV